MQTESVSNDKVEHGLRVQFSKERVDAILSQAQSMFLQIQFQSGVGADVPTPETYELFEGGLDRPSNGISKVRPLGEWTPENNSVVRRANERQTREAR